MDNINQHLQQTAEKSQDAILVADQEGVIRYWNAGAERILGYTAAESVGQSLDLFIPEKLRGRHWDGYHRVMDIGRPTAAAKPNTRPACSHPPASVRMEPRSRWSSAWCC